MNLRPHHIICITRLYSAIKLYKENEQFYFDSIKEELKRSSNLRDNLLDCCKYTWGIIYNIEVMKILSEVIDKESILVNNNTCDSICSCCYGRTDEKCTSEDRIQIMDNLSSNILNITANNTIRLTYEDNINFDKVCSMCGTQKKCNLIRRAISFN